MSSHTCSQQTPVPAVQPALTLSSALHSLDAHCEPAPPQSLLRSAWSKPTTRQYRKSHIVCVWRCECSPSRTVSHISLRRRRVLDHPI
eukprot:807501-Rhodomonas_salina.1